MRTGCDEGERIEVLVPHPFAFLILKRFAMRDRSLKTNDAQQQYHALDPCCMWAGMSPTEYDEVQSLARDFADHPVVREAASIVASHFANVSAVGAVALAEQAGGQALRDRNAFEQFMRDLRGFFGIAE